MIYTVWTDNKIHCQRLNDKINDPDYVILDNNLYTEQELMEVLSKCRMTINFKLYANVISQATGVPAIPLGYRFKVFDYSVPMGFLHHVVSTSSIQLTQELLERVEYIENNREMTF